MPLHPQPAPNPYSKSGVLWLNGFVWSAIVLCFVIGGNSNFWGAVLFGFLAALVGVGGNAGLCLWKLFRGSRYQAGLYFIAFIPLVVVLLCLWNAAGHIGKIGG